MKSKAGAPKTKPTKSKAKAAPRTAQDPFMLDRLKAQLAVQKRLDEIHLNRRLLDEMAFYPAHDKRLETPEYKAVHEKLTKTLDLPCLVCGVKFSTLKDKSANRYGAKQMETHHHVIEWALANAISADKFNATLLPNLRQRHADKPEYQSDFTDKQVAAWVDHSEDNLWVLCDVHHRAKYFGIHEITFPIWGPMDLLKPDFEAYVKEQIAKAKGEKSQASKNGAGKKSIKKKK